MWQVYKNGNYMVMINTKDGTKIRRTNDDKFIPSFAENCDCKITDKCDGDCPYCYEGCSRKGKHGSLMDKPFFDTLHPYTELAINGNDMTHPELIPFLNKMKDKKVIVNITVNQKHFEKNYDLLKDLYDKKLINGLGVSLISPTFDFINKIKTFKTAVLHVINGIFSEEDFDVIKGNKLKVLILGYKERGRGNGYLNSFAAKVQKNQEWLKKNLNTVSKEFLITSFDNLALRQLAVEQFVSKEDWEKMYMGDDGDFTFYLDCVNNKFSKNSIADDTNRFDLLDNIDDMFNIIKNKHS